jgi:hypothetical protein
MIKKPRKRGGHSPRWAAEPEKIIIIINYELCTGLALKLGHFGKKIRNTWKVLKRSSREGWRRSFGPIV